jgi:hypothetical protein
MGLAMLLVLLALIIGAVGLFVSAQKIGAGHRRGSVRRRRTNRMGTPERSRLSGPVPPGSDEVLATGSPLIARCPTFEAAESTVEYLYNRGVPRQALSVVADEVRAAAGAGDGGRWLRWRRWSAARMQVHRSVDPELIITRRYYIFSVQNSARRARLLLRTGANTEDETFGVLAVPCVGQLSSELQHPSHDVLTTVRPPASER